ncbi:MAG: DUF1801 domain-containing protein [Acidobacteria bacterium]|nr:DUF1801 domain-containing protein [Acidobacteriota bacterium]
MQSKATTVDAYLEELPEDRRAAMKKLRATIKKHLPKGFAEGMQYGMIGYFVPHKLFPPGYHCNPKEPLPYASVASQKNYISIYLMSAYIDSAVEKYIKTEFAARGLKLDMGKCCVRFKKIDDIPHDIIGEAIAMTSVADHIQSYEDILLSPA